MHMQAGKNEQKRKVAESLETQESVLILYVWLDVWLPKRERNAARPEANTAGLWNPPSQHQTSQDLLLLTDCKRCQSCVEPDNRINTYTRFMTYKFINKLIKGEFIPISVTETERLFLYQASRSPFSLGEGSLLTPLDAIEVLQEAG